MEPVLPIFVYGTLKRGEERARMWPCAPQRVDRACTRGTLVDLGPYPALLPGDSVVGGELWYISPQDMQVTLDVLDRIECFGIDDVDLYVRRMVTCRDEQGEEVTAYTYFLADPDQAAGMDRVAPDPDGACRWRRYAL